MLTSMGKLLGIDYGARRVGLALSDDGETFAFPHGILENNNTLMEAVDTLVCREGIRMIVVGEADNPAGGANTIQRRVMIFAEALRVRTGCEVVTVTEAYSSAEARRAVEKKATERTTAQVPVDSAAASIILQAYLDGAPHGRFKK
jgi:putative holliday junction resolvase